METKVRSINPGRWSLGEVSRADQPIRTSDAVLVQVIQKNRKPMAFQDLLATIKKGKLVKTNSKDFANVLRKVLSTSTAVKRVARATYGV